MCQEGYAGGNVHLGGLRGWGGTCTWEGSKDPVIWSGLLRQPACWHQECSQTCS